MTNSPAVDREVREREVVLFTEQYQRILCRTDRMFAWLMLGQWVAGIILAITVSPRAWAGVNSQVHPHVWAAIFLGGIIASFPVTLAFCCPGKTITRHIIAVGQMLSSALLIHLTGGRIETHFHVFGSLAFLAFYRDWRVIVTATVVVALDHFLRGLYWPESVFGVLSSNSWRWIEHAAWVLFEDAFLILSIRQSHSEMYGVAERQAALENINYQVECQVTERTAALTQEIAERTRAETELRAKHAEVQAVNDGSPLGMARTDARGQCTYANRVLLSITGLTLEQMLATGWQKALHPEDRQRVCQEWEQAVRSAHGYSTVYRIEHSDGRTVWVSVKAAPILQDQALLGYVVTVEDITDRKSVEVELNSINQQLIETSRQAGMAEVATGVLHNVGNVLNSVNVSASLISDRLSRSKVQTLSRILETVSKDGGDWPTFLQNDPRGPGLPTLLEQMARHLAGERDSLLEEAESLKKNLEHIKDIVAMQQSYARVAGVTEQLKVTDLILDVLRMNGSALERHGISVVQQLAAAIPEIITDKHKVLQILVNLVRNAKYACVESNRVDKQIVLRASNGGNRVKIAVSDNGVGIPPENLTKIFSHGFTTRKNGHGFGLHSGALAAKELGGALIAFSDGPGRGATFTLELPINPVDSLNNDCLHVPAASNLACR
jgi:PAS domain S-box-containing protein